MSEFPKNQAEVTGVVTREPFRHEYGEGKTLTRMNCEVRDDRDRRTYINIVAFDDLSDKVKSVDEGTRLYAKGVLQKARDWTDRDGQKRFGSIEIIADELTILGKRNSSGPEKVDF